MISYDEHSSEIHQDLHTLQENQDIQERKARVTQIIVDIETIFPRYRDRFHHFSINLCSSRSKISTCNDRDEQTFQKEEIYRIELAESRNDRANVSEVNLKRRKLFQFNRFEQKVTVHFAFLKTLVRKNRDKFQTIHCMTF